ncbi:MAG: LPS export ABC transporter ATP-binding protein [Magnetococcus sp. XQGC-1]
MSHAGQSSDTLDGGRPETAAGRALEAIHLGKSFRGRKVVSHVDLSLLPGEVVGLLGPNGAGKTTTFYMFVGLVTPEEGSIRLDGQDITHAPMHQRARSGISYLPQEPSIFRKMTVRDNVLAILETLSLTREQRLERLEELLSELGVLALARTPGYALSGGERRRVEVARALAIEPRYILLDEPFAGVDPLGWTSRLWKCWDRRRMPPSTMATTAWRASASF